MYLAKEILLSSSDLSTVSEMQIGGGAGKEANGKQALTRFQRICTDGTHSIVLCRPVTGRTHQVYLLSEFCTLHCFEYHYGQMHLTVERHYLTLGLDISKKLVDTPPIKFHDQINM